MNIFKKTYWTFRLALGAWVYRHGYKKAGVVIASPVGKLKDVVVEGKKDVKIIIEEGSEFVKSSVTFVSGMMVKTLLIVGVISIIGLVFYKRIQKIIA